MLSKLLSSFIDVFKYHKKKILLFFIFTSIFLYLLFPLNDLGDLVTSKVSEATAGQLYVGFDKLHIGLIPSPALELENVFVESAFLPAISAGILSASPNVLGLLTFKPGATIRGQKVLGGDFTLSTRGGDKTSTGKPKQKISFEFENMKLTEIFSLINLPLRITGQASGELQTQVDLDFAEQPSGDLKVSITKVLMEESDLFIQGMPIGLPRLNLNSVEIDAKSDKGRLDIKKLNIGKPGQDFSAQVTGQIQISFLKQMGNIIPSPGNYDLNIKLTLNENVKLKLGAFVSLLSQYMVAQNTYSIKIGGNGFYAPPTTITKGQ